MCFSMMTTLRNLNYLMNLNYKRMSADVKQNAGFVLTLPMLRLLSPKIQGRKVSENHLNPVMLVFI